MGEDYEGYLPESPEQTFYVGNYYKAPVEGYVQATGGAPSQPCTPVSYTHLTLPTIHSV